MPSVEMRRSTRVFVPKSAVKDTDSVRVLRSGKQLLLESREGKHGRGETNNNDEWFELIDHSRDSPRDSYFRKRRSSVVSKPDDVRLVANLDIKESKVCSGSFTEEMGDNRFGTVYNRKRRRSPAKERNLDTDRKYGSQYVRKKRRNLEENKDFVETTALNVGFSRQERSFSSSSTVKRLDVIVEFSPTAVRWFTSFLVSVLKFMRLSQMRLSHFAAFLCSDSIFQVFSDNGIHFLPDSFRMISGIHNLSSGLCQIFGAQDFVPLLSVDYSAIPLWFTSLHLSVLRRSLYLPDVLLSFLTRHIKNVPRVIDNKTSISCIPSEVTFLGSNGLISGSFKANSAVGDTDCSVGKSLFTKYGTISQNAKRKRSTLRPKRAKHLSSLNFQASVLTVNVDHAAVSTSEFHQGQSPCSSIKEVQSTLSGTKQSFDSAVCNASLLTTESDRCHRTEGTKVMLECTSSKEWYVIVKNQGVTKYVFKPQETMRPHTFNRFTHALIWPAEDGLKLEFSDRQDWLTFKELYKECGKRNAELHSAKTIPVPGVYEVPDYVELEPVPFVRPVSYITMHNDEVSRALLKRTANYDIDTADEDWINEQNNRLQVGDDGVVEHLSAEKFEELMDVFERAAYRSPGVISDESKALSLCANLGRMDMVTAVYHYWVKKRKQMDEALIRVFQCPPPKKAQGVQEKVLRKRRSLKRQASVVQRCKDKNFPEEVVPDVAQATKAAEEAQSIANKSLELAVRKRKRAEALMQKAELATYWAMMSLRIAEVAQVTKAPDTKASFDLG